MKKLGNILNPDKFIESIELDDEWEIETDTGWEPITHIHKTIPYKVYKISTKDFSLECADEHIVMGENFDKLYVKDILPGTKIQTKVGLQSVISVERSTLVENMYDITVNSDSHTFYTDGILSHNTTLATVYILWYSLFQANKTIAILANREKTAMEILRRIREAYHELPLWLQQGIVEWSKTAVTLENGSRIMCGSTASSSFRGESIALLYLDEFAFVPTHVADDFVRSVFPTISSGKSSKIIISSCVTDNTWVYTDKGLTQVRNFIDYDKSGGYEVDGYKVLGRHKLRDGNIFHNDGKKPTKVIKTTSSEIECSFMHKFWACKDGEYRIYRAHELEEGDYVSIQYGMEIWGDNDDISDFVENTTNGRKQLKFGDTITPDLAYFLGMYIAEGCRSRGSNVSISVNDAVLDSVKILDLDYTIIGSYYTICNDNMSFLLKHLGFDLYVESGSIIIPDRLMQMSRDNTILMVQGIFECRGFVTNGSIGIDLSSKELVIQLKMLLMNLGILSSYQELDCSIVNVIESNSNIHRLVINIASLEIFNEIFSLCITRYDKYNLTYTLSNEDVIPFSKEVIENKSKFFKFFGILSKLFSNNEHISRDYFLSKRDELLQFSDESIKEFIEDNVSENLKWEKIKSIEESENFVYDFSLPDDAEDKWDHSVIHNGFNAQNTPNGLGSFYHLYRGAVKNENNFRPIKVNWWEVPGRDEDWKEAMIRDIGAISFNQEYGAIFLGSSSTLIEGEMLERLGNYTKEPIRILLNHLLKVYDEPEDDGFYILGVDSAGGTGRDYSVVQVLKIVDEFEIHQVAVYRNNVIAPNDFAQVVISISEYYNGAYIMIESNDVGGQVTDSIFYEFEYDKVLNCDPKGLGIRATKKSKLAGNMLLKRYVESGWLHLYDKHTFFELSMYEETTPEVFKASGNEHDDCVTSLFWGLYFIITEFFDGKDMSKKSIHEKFRLRDMEESIEPVIISDSDVKSNDDEGFSWPGETGYSGDDGNYNDFV